MIGRNTRPTPPSASRSHAAISWKVDPRGISAEYAGSRVSPAPCTCVPAFTGVPLVLDQPLAELVVRSVLYHFSDSDESVPSACMSCTILLTAVTRLVLETGSFLSKAMHSGSK